MTHYAISDDEFIALWEKHASATIISKEIGVNVRNVLSRRRRIEHRYDVQLNPKANHGNAVIKLKKIEQTDGNVRRGINIEKGRVIVFSDAHFQPDEVTTAYKALLQILKQFKGQIKAIVANGDIFDGSQASRHPRINWSRTPTVKEELIACQEFMGGIEKLAGNAELIWTLGNHDARFETYLSNSGITTYEGVLGFQLKDHFPFWKSCWSFWVNEDTVIKHRLKGGFGAGRANALNSGCNMITGHTHNLSVMPVTDYNGTRWGVQTGTLADPKSDAFIHYIEDAPTDWRSGFVVLSWENSRMLMPEMVMVSGEDEYEFRGAVHRV